MLKQILLELQTRLETGLIAGSNILLSDERIPFILQKVDMLATKSPIFQKLAALCKAIFEDQEHLEANILDALSFLDAVLLTQADWKYEKATENIPILTEKAYTNIKYSQLKPIIQALSTTGGGRYEIIRSTWMHQPELFQDYRILPHVIHGLNDSYGELANLNEEILKSCGKKIVPLLKDGFDPTGKKDMIRRMKLIVQLGGKEENEFYLATYPVAQPEIQKEIILGLSCDDANRDYLLHIANTEKGKRKEMAYHALSRIRDEIVDDYLWQKTKKNKKFLAYALYSNHEEIKEALCESIEEKLTSIMKYSQISNIKEKEELIDLLSLLAYKTGDKIMDTVAWIFDQDQQLRKIKDFNKHQFKIYHDFAYVHPINFMQPIAVSYTISKYVMEALFHTYLAYRNDEIISMIETLYQRYPSIGVNVYAKMLFLQDYAHAYDHLTQTIECKKPRGLYADIWRYIEYDQEMKQYVFRSILINDSLKQDTVEVALGDSLDIRWIALLQDKKVVKKGLFKKSEETVYGIELPICSRIMVQLADPDSCICKESLLPYFEKNKQTICHLYIKKLYGLAVTSDVIAYIKKYNNKPYELVEITKYFCAKDEALHILRTILSQLKGKSAHDGRHYYIESAIRTLEESEEC